MKIKVVDTDQYEGLFCPKSKLLINFDESDEGVIEASCCLGVLIDEVPDEAIEGKEPFASEWSTYYAESSEKEDAGYLEEILLAMETDLVAHKVTTHGFGCGPISQTAYYIFTPEDSVKVRLAEAAE